MTVGLLYTEQYCNNSQTEHSVSNVLPWKPFEDRRLQTEPFELLLTVNNSTTVRLDDLKILVQKVIWAR